MADTSPRSGLEKLINATGVTQSYTAKDAERKWVLIDAQGQRVGRLATQIADILRGKNKPTFTRHDDVGDFVVVINASGLVLHGNDKLNKKIYYKHTPWMGHLKQRTGAQMLDKNADLMLRLAVRGMVPHGALGNRIMKKLKIYTGAEHPHKAQRPEVVQLSKPAAS